MQCSAETVTVCTIYYHSAVVGEGPTVCVGSEINKNFFSFCQMITLGGDAELELVDSLDPFTEGVVFSVRPPKKSWKNISNLSGGEKTLSSLALVSMKMS